MVPEQVQLLVRLEQTQDPEPESLVHNLTPDDIPPAPTDPTERGPDQEGGCVRRGGSAEVSLGSGVLVYEGGRVETGTVEIPNPSGEPRNSGEIFGSILFRR